jgi:hypothetical protein
MRAAGQGSRPRWDRPVGGRVRAARAAIAAALLGLIVVGLTGPGVRARTWLAAAGGALVPYAYQAIQIQDATIPAPDATVDGYPPVNAVDGSSSLAWAITWTDRDVPTRCGTSSSPTLLIRFTEPADISRVIVNPGLDPTDANRIRQVLPRAVDITTSIGDCTRLTLTPDGGGAQEFPVDLHRTADVRVQIVDVDPARPGTAQGDQLAALSEIRFYSG